MGSPSCCGLVLMLLLPLALRLRGRATAVLADGLGSGTAGPGVPCVDGRYKYDERRRSDESSFHLWFRVFSR